MYMQMRDAHDDGQTMTYLTEFLKASWAFTDDKHTGRRVHMCVYNMQQEQHYKRMTDASTVLSHTSEECPPAGRTNKFTK